MNGLILNSGQFLIKKDNLNIKIIKNQNLKIQENTIFLNINNEITEDLYMKLHIENQTYFIQDIEYKKVSFNSIEFDDNLFNEINVDIKYDMLKNITDIFDISDIGYISFYEINNNEKSEDKIIYKTFEKFLIYNKYFFDNDIEEKVDYYQTDYLSEDEVNELNNYYYKFSQNDFNKIFLKIYKESFKSNIIPLLTTNF
jgi:hypothetical protein